MQYRSLVGTLALCVALAACTLPRGAALQNDILGDQDLSETGEARNFAVHAVTQDFLGEFANWSTPGANRDWIAHKHSGTESRIKRGDVLNLEIWDSSENSLLTSAGQRAVQIPNIQVSSKGTIFLPYMGEVTVAGLSVDAARNRIQARAEETTPLAQVVLTRTSGVPSSADLVGGVGRPGFYPIPEPHFTVLNLLSSGGGVSPGMRNPQVTLVRKGRNYVTSLQNIYDDPAADTIVQGGDKVIVQQDDRYFRALGATGGDALHYFNKEQISALDALAMIGGLEAARADPKGILVFREYPAQYVGANGPKHQRTVFVVDLTSADGTFSAGRFPIQPEDTVLVTESPINNVRTVFSLIGSVFGLANTANNL